MTSNVGKLLTISVISQSHFVLLKRGWGAMLANVGPLVQNMG